MTTLQSIPVGNLAHLNLKVHLSIKGEAALVYANMGWAVFPISAREDKVNKPIVDNGFKQASKEPVQIMQWWQRWPDANIGFVPHSANLLVLDVDIKDGRQGEAQLETLTAQLGKLPKTLTQRSPSGGYHLFFKCSEPFSNARLPGASDIDVRSANGYVAVEPSVKGGKRYAFEDCELLEGEVPQIANLPSAWTEALKQVQSAENNSLDLSQSIEPELPDLEKRFADFLAKSPKAQNRWAGNREDLTDKSDSAMVLSMARLMRIQADFTEGDYINQMGKWSVLKSKRQIRELRRTWATAKSEKVTPDDFDVLLNAVAVESTIKPYPTPIPLALALPPVTAFNPGFLPGELRAHLMDISERMQCPPDFGAVAAITALSAVVGAKVCIAPKARDDWRIIPNLWGMVVGRPSVKKSPPTAAALKPLHRIEMERRKQHSIDMKSFNDEDEIFKLQQKALADELKKAIRNDMTANTPESKETIDSLINRKANEQEPEPPLLRRLVANNINPASLFQVLKSNPFGLLIENDELIQFLKSCDKPGNEDLRGLCLTGFDGNKPFTVDRVGSGLDQHIPQVCLSIFGTIQPARLSEYLLDAVAGSSGDDGFIQRFQLLVWPDYDRDFEYVDQWPDTKAKQAYNAVFDRLEALEVPESHEHAPVFRFDPEAQQVFAEWITALEDKKAKGDKSGEIHPAMIAHLGKYPKLICALALLFHLVDSPESEAIPKAHLIRAIAFGEYLESHAHRAYEAVARRPIHLAHEMAKKIQSAIRKKSFARQFTARDIGRKNWTGFSDAKDIEKALDVLLDHAWILDVTEPSQMGRPTTTYALNPIAWSGYDGLA